MNGGKARIKPPFPASRTQRQERANAEAAEVLALHENLLITDKERRDMLDVIRKEYLDLGPKAD